MAEVVKVPIIGNVKTPWLYAGGAAIAGIVGYAWWSRGTAAAEEEGFAVELPVDEFTPPTIIDSGISVGGRDEAEPIARTNIEWRNMAQAEGEALGFSQSLVQSALTKYLGKARLSVSEAACMSAIVAILGQPPTGGPYSIALEPITPPPPHEEPPPTQPPPTQPPPTQPPPSQPPAQGPPPTPTGFAATGAKGGVFLSWYASPGATGYEVIRMTASGNDTPWHNVGNTTALFLQQLVPEDTQYAYAVRAYGPGGYSGAAHSAPTWVLR